MNRIRPENLGEKWVLYIVKNTLEERWSTKYYPPIMVALAIFVGILASLDKNIILMVVAISLLFEALILFERWHFTRIIKRQQEQIDGLDKELNTIKLGK